MVSDEEKGGKCEIEEIIQAVVPLTAQLFEEGDENESNPLMINRRSSTYGSIIINRDLEGNPLNGTKPLSLHGRIRRAIFQGDLFLSAMKKIFPSSNSRNLNHWHRAYVLSNGMHEFAYTLLPLITLGLLAHDGIEYALLPSRRYGMQADALFSGAYRTTWGQMGAFDGFPNEAEFWALPGSLLAVPLVSIAIEALRQRYYFTHRDEILNTLRSVYQSPSCFSSFLQSLPYSPYRNALNVARFFLRWGWDLEKRQHSQLEKIAQLAEDAPLLLSLPAISTLTYAANTHENAKQSLKNITAVGVRAEVARHARWKLGEPSKRKRHAAASTAYSLAKAIPMASWFYLAYRMGKMYYTRGQQWYEFKSKERDCHAQNGTWDYSPQTGEYACTACGDWSFVPPQLAENSSACLDHLMSTQRSWFDFFNGVQRVRDVSEFGEWYFDEINFSAWHIGNWSETLTQQVLDAIAPLTSHWRVANFSSPTLTPLWSGTQVLDRIAIYLNDHTVMQLDISHLNMGAVTWSSFLDHWQIPYQLTSLFSAQNGLTDQSIIEFSAWYTNHSVGIQDIDFSGNSITNAGLQVMLTHLQPNQTHYLNVANNQLTEESLSSIATWLPTSGNTRLVVGGQDLTGGNFAGFGYAIAQTPGLYSLDLRHTNLDGVPLLDLSSSWLNQSIALEVLIVEGNLLTGQDIASFGLATTNNHIKRVDWSYNPIDNDGLQAIQTVLKNVTWTEINISGIAVDALHLANFWSYLPASSIRSVIAGGFGFGDDAFSPLVSLLEHQNITLDSLDLSGNRLSNDLAGKLMHHACRAGVQHIWLENNYLSNMFGFLDKASATDYRCTHLHLAGNLFNDTDVMPLIHSLPQSPFEMLDLSRSLVRDKTAFQLAQQLISPIPNPDDLLAEDYPYDEDRYLHKHTQANTQLNEVRLDDTQITEKGKRALKRVDAHLPQPTAHVRNSLWHQPAARYALPAQNANTSATLSAEVLLAAVPIVNILLMLLLFYRVSRYAISSMSAHKSSFFNAKRSSLGEASVARVTQDLAVDSPGSAALHAASPRLQK